MINFKEFINQQNTEEMKDVEKTLLKLPKNHSMLVQNYNWQFHPGNTLNNDNKHVGYVDDSNKEIAVAAPWNYGREFTILHEVAHKVWEKYVMRNPKLVKKWEFILSQTVNGDEKNQDSLQQSPEELFCMSYATYYSKHKVLTYYKKEWMNFVQQIK